MVIEQVTLNVNAGQESGFEAAMVEARSVLAAAEGSRSVQLVRGVESPSKYVLRIEWNAIDDHTAFTRTEGIVRFRALVGSYFAERPQMEHFSVVP